MTRIDPNDLGRIFPIADAVSARLMKIKARCLRSAGVLPPALEAEVDRRANATILGALHPTVPATPRAPRKTRVSG